MGGEGRRAPAEGVVERPALGKEGRPGDGLRARHALRPAGLPAAPRAFRADAAEGGARAVHPPRAGRRRVRDAPAVLRAQPASGARDREPRAQVASPGRAGRRRADPRLLRQPDPGRHPQHRRLRGLVRRGRQGQPEAAVPEPRRPDAPRGGRHHHRPVPQDAADRRHRHGPHVSLRARQPARRRDADGATLRAEPGARAARRMAGARHAQGEGAPAAQEPAAEAASPLRAAARLCRWLRVARKAG